MDNRLIITKYKNGISRKANNKRVTLQKIDGGYFLNFRCIDKENSDIERIPSKKIRFDIVETGLKLSDQAMIFLMQNFIDLNKIGNKI